ncbi:unnamed protein product [Callosobruchus maculatus]|uniref:Uncharacterized protein n=1 Tax=Callosobruchus maculatus TaxID=64391 RepID=A0A653D532_CALMS|nr:unnamed protein product [Callosobruchus maculatus]
MKPKYSQSYRAGVSVHGSQIKVVSFLLKPLGQDPQPLSSPSGISTLPQYHPGQAISQPLNYYSALGTYSIESV